MICALFAAPSWADGVIPIGYLPPAAEDSGYRTPTVGQQINLKTMSLAEFMAGAHEDMDTWRRCRDMASSNRRRLTATVSRSAARQGAAPDGRHLPKVSLPGDLITVHIPALDLTVDVPLKITTLRAHAISAAGPVS